MHVTLSYLYLLCTCGRWVVIIMGRVDAPIMSRHVLWVIHTNKCGSIQLLASYYTKDIRYSGTKLQHIHRRRTRGVKGDHGPPHFLSPWRGVSNYLNARRRVTLSRSMRARVPQCTRLGIVRIHAYACAYACAYATVESCAALVGVVVKFLRARFARATL